MGIFSGLTADTSKHLQLDAGMFIRNYDMTKTVAQNKANIIGATAGGGSFSAVPTIRQIEVDGKKGAVKGFQALDEWTVTMTANVKEMTAASLKLSLAAAASAAEKVPSAAESNNYTKITGKSEIAAEDYSDNVAWVGRISGSSEPVIIIIKNALATNGLSLSFADKSEAVMAVTITGHYTIDDLETPPFEIHYPNIT